MLAILLMRSALAVLSALLGGFGVFCAIMSIDNLGISAYAVVCLGTAFAISYWSNRP